MHSFCNGWGDAGEGLSVRLLSLRRICRMKKGGSGPNILMHLNLESFYLTELVSASIRRLIGLGAAAIDRTGPFKQEQTPFSPGQALGERKYRYDDERENDYH